MRISIPAFNDMHVHLREGELLPLACAWSAKHTSYMLVMPNLKKPVLTYQDVNRYRLEILKHCGSTTPLMTIKFVDETTPDILLQAIQKGSIQAVKLYPEGVTTNSEDGVGIDYFLNPPQRFWDCLDIMSRYRIPFCLHGALPGSFVLRSEQDFLKEFVNKLLTRGPRYLKVVLEHISTTESVSFTLYWYRTRGNIAATITPHHAMLTLDDILLGKLRPHNYCAPVAKTPEDREALIKAMTGDDDCFFLGSDSAPHPEESKICTEGCAGICSAPVLPNLICQLFASANKIDRIKDFVSGRAAKFYGFTSSGNISVEESPYEVPDKIDSVVPFQAGKTLGWSLA